MKTQNRIIAFKDLSALSKTLKDQEKTVVFTNGIFDFLHTGHVTYLEKARELGDTLIIGLNSDASTKRLKGEGRPINPQDDRACVIAALRCVDYVCIFEEDNAIEALKALKPQIYAKGGDYTPETLIEAPIVVENGGKVVIVPLVGDHSNTKQYKKIQNIDPNSKRADTVSTR